MEKIKKINLKIPNLGEAESTEIIELSINIGQKVKINDPLIVLESEKAAMEVPSDYTGEISEIFVKEGDSVNEGLVFAEMKILDSKEEKPDQQKEDPIKKVDAVEIEASQEDIRNQNTNANLLNSNNVNAGPAVRKYARELEIDLSKIIPTGQNGRITKDDLKKYIHSNGSTFSHTYANLEDLKSYGDFKIENQSKIRQLGAKNLFLSWATIPHVSHFEEANISKLEIQRKDLNSLSAIKISPLSFLIKATTMALEEYPIFNSSIVAEGKIMIKEYINIGIAVSTKEGLVVPVIRNADKMNIGEIAKSINVLSEKAREKKLMNNEISGSTFTISSLGLIGGTGFTPIINPPEVGIIGVSRTRKSIDIIEDKISTKSILPFTLSYDHRVINGVDAGNFMTFIKNKLEEGI